jgi:hypothetical protein
MSRTVIRLERGAWVHILAAASLIAGLSAGAVAGPSGADPEDPEGSPDLPRIGGWVMLADGVTLIVALPERAKLAYVDTLAEKEIKRVDLPFKPDLLAVQGKRLFASVSGGSAIHVLDLDSGVDRGALHLPEGPATGLACNPSKGPLFATLPDPTMAGAAVVIDPITGAIAYTGHMVPNAMDPRKVAGLTLAVDPSNADGFYTLAPWAGGRHATPGRTLVKATIRSPVPYRPYAGPPFKPPHHDPQAMPAGLVAPASEYATYPRVARADSMVHASGNGKLVGVIDFDGNGVSVLLGRNPGEKVGMMDCPSTSDFAFHPALDLAAAEGDGPPRKKERTLYLFNGKSLAEVARFPLGHGPPDDEPNGRLLTFGGRGTKLVYYDASRGKRLRFFPIELTEKDRETLDRAYASPHAR